MIYLKTSQSLRSNMIRIECNFRGPFTPVNEMIIDSLKWSYGHLRLSMLISCTCDTRKQPLIPKIVSVTCKMTNEWSKVQFSIKWIGTIFRKISNLRWFTSNTFVNQTGQKYIELYGNEWKSLVYHNNSHPSSQI